MAASAVAVNTAPFGMPSMLLNMLGLTARIYAIVRKVVIPATISVRTLCFEESKPKALLRKEDIAQKGLENPLCTQARTAVEAAVAREVVAELDLGTDMEVVHTEALAYVVPDLRLGDEDELAF